MTDIIPTYLEITLTICAGVWALAGIVVIGAGLVFIVDYIRDS